MKISILLVTYNHSKYICQCMDGIQLQQLPGETEIIIADDYSSDDTINIIHEYMDKIPCQFTFLTTDTNIGIVKNYQRAFAACKGDYIAVIEGDDYWTDPLRLKKHVDFLDNHHECVMTMNRMVVYQEGKALYSVTDWNDKENYIYVTSQEMAGGNKLGNLSACVLRKKEMDKIKKDLFDLPVADWMIGLVLGQYGFIAILKDVMSVYRIHEQGQWSKINKEEQDKFMISLIDIYNKYLEYKYDHEFSAYKSILMRNDGYIPVKKRSVRDFIPPAILGLIKLIVPPFVIRKNTTRSLRSINFSIKQKNKSI